MTKLVTTLRVWRCLSHDIETNCKRVPSGVLAPSSKARSP